MTVAAPKLVCNVPTSWGEALANPVSFAYANDHGGATAIGNLNLAGAVLKDHMQGVKCMASAEGCFDFTMLTPAAYLNNGYSTFDNGFASRGGGAANSARLNAIPA